jgi:hypothetical protein
LLRINNTDNEMNNHGDSRALRRIKNTVNQRKRRQDPARREEEQVAHTAQWRIAREEPGRREEEQVANTAQRRIAREQLGIRREEEQVADTARRRIAREQPGIREEEQEADTARRHIAREQPGYGNDVFSLLYLKLSVRGGAFIRCSPQSTPQMDHQLQSEYSSRHLTVL